MVKLDSVAMANQLTVELAGYGQQSFGGYGQPNFAGFPSAQPQLNSIYPQSSYGAFPPQQSFASFPPQSYGSFSQQPYGSPPGASYNIGGAYPQSTGYPPMGSNQMGPFPGGSGRVTIVCCAIPQ
jgi:hypothetical protein